MNCQRCGRRLAAGEPYVTFTTQTEHEDRDGVVVEQSELLLTTCVACAPSTDAATAALESLLR